MQQKLFIIIIITIIHVTKTQLICSQFGGNIKETDTDTYPMYPRDLQI